MGIDVQWRDENGQILGAVEDSAMLLSRLNALFFRQSSSACVRFIDPAGEACFNQQQMPVLLTELHQVLRLVSDTRTAEHLHEVIRLVEGADKVHTYLWFVGD